MKEATIDPFDVAMKLFNGEHKQQIKEKFKLQILDINKLLEQWDKDDPFIQFVCNKYNVETIEELAYRIGVTEEIVLGDNEKSIATTDKQVTIESNTQIEVTPDNPEVYIELIQALAYYQTMIATGVQDPNVYQISEWDLTILNLIQERFSDQNQSNNE